MAIEVDENSTGDNKPEGTAAGAKSAAATPQPAKQPIAAAAQTVAHTAGDTQQQQQSTIKQPQYQGSRAMISSRTNYGISRAATSVAMRSILEVIDKIVEGEPERPVDFKYYALDGEKEGLLISAVVVSARLKNPSNDQKFVAHHTLLLAQTARGATVVEQQITTPTGVVKYDRLVVPADAYDATLRGRVAEVVQADNPGFRLIDAEATAVPPDVDLKSEEAVRNVIANATTAASTMLSSEVASDAWIITPEVAQQTFVNEVKASWPHMVDLTAQPVRGDVVLEMSVLTGRQQNTQGNQEFQYNTSQARQLITQTMGYMDIISTPSLAQAGPFGFGAQGNLAQTAEQLKIYTPRFVITNLDAPEEAAELPIVLQALGTLQSLVNDNRWIGCLVQQHRNGAAHAENGVNIRDLSAIGLEAPQQVPMGYVGGELPKQGRLPLNSANVNEGMLAAAIQTYFHPDLLISMDVPECGASTWILSVFAAAARGDQQAIRDIFEAADLLTGNRFTPIYKAACGGTMKNPVFNDNMYVNLGFYWSQGGKRDIRDGDYLAVLNATGDTELNTITDWSDLQANTDVDPFFRLTETRRIQQDLFESMTITGRAARVTFNPALIYALAAAVQEAGLVYDTKIGMAAPQGTARMVAPYMRQLPTGLGNAGAFVAGGGRRQGGQGLGTAGSFGRYAYQQRGTGTGSGNY